MIYDDVRKEVESNQSLAPLADIIKDVMDSDTSALAEVEAFEVASQFITKKVERQEAQAISTLANTFDANGLTRDQLGLLVEAYTNDLRNFAKTVEPEEKRKLLSLLFEKVIDITKKCVDKYHSYNIVLPMTLEEGAQAPTYAHDSDAAADLYAAEDITLPAHSLSNLIKTGVRIALPENWQALILPRSSIGMKTGLRLSNSAGVIDPQYRGELGVIYDNHSDSDYEIKKGDRIAQMLIFPVYRFKAQVVDQLDDTERGDGAYGSTGK